MNKITSTLAIGVDIVKVSRFHDIITKPGRGLQSKFITRLAGRILNPIHELPVATSLINTNDINGVVRFLAGSWALKEAVYKTLDESQQQQFQFNQWFRLYDKRGKPIIIGDGYPNGEEFLLTISHDSDVLVAMVLRQEIGFISSQNKV